jgi:hypothetical protein
MVFLAKRQGLNINRVAEICGDLSTSKCSQARFKLASMPAEVTVNAVEEVKAVWKAQICPFFRQQIYIRLPATRQAIPKR